MKTLYADGKTGKVAIMEGDLDTNAVGTPLQNLHKLYFHSELNYLYRVHSVSGSVVLPSGHWHERREHSVLMTTVGWDPLDIPVVFFKINGLDTCGHRIVDFSLSQANSFYNGIRAVRGYSRIVGGTLEIGASQYSIAITGSRTINLSADIYTISRGVSSNSIEFSAEKIMMSGGKFISNRKYLHEKQGGFKVPLGQTMTWVNNYRPYNNDNYDNIQVGI